MQHDLQIMSHCDRTPWHKHIPAARPIHSLGQQLQLLGARQMLRGQISALKALKAPSALTPAPPRTPLRKPCTDANGDYFIPTDEGTTMSCDSTMLARIAAKGRFTGTPPVSTYHEYCMLLKLWPLDCEHMML
jgi:hypothetical protein